MDKSIKPKHQELLAVFIALIIIVLSSNYYILLSFAQKNDSLQSSASGGDEITWSDIIIPLLSAFGGAIIAAGLTYKISHGLENRREKRAENEEREFNRRLAQLIRLEIKDCLNFLENSLAPIKKQVPYESELSDRLQIEISQLKRILFRMFALPRSYSELQTERKVKAFPPDILDALEWGYRYFNQLLSNLQYKYEVRERVGNNVEFSKTDLDECLKNLRLAMDKIATIT
ncbi:hypothetical protein BH18THE2_BH18THE2_40320 [soil metagenome]